MSQVPVCTLHDVRDTLQLLTATAVDKSADFAFMFRRGVDRIRAPIRKKAKHWREIVFTVVSHQSDIAKLFEHIGTELIRNVSHIDP